ncbi:MAG: hypothetical protein LBM93_09725 [Oscillospiraceae bacterium]|jgi:hypothetical protein|nr:hypothetical protein [Oscillospiraceae bacterium]
MGKNQDRTVVDGQTMIFAKVMSESGLLSPSNKQAFINDCCLPQFRNLDSDVFPTSILSIAFGDSDSVWSQVSVKDAIISVTNWIEKQTMKKAKITLPSMFSRTNRRDYDFLDTGTFAPGEFFHLALGHNQIAEYDSLMHHNREYGLQGYNLSSDEQGTWALSLIKMQRKMGAGRMGAQMFGFKTEQLSDLLGIFDYVLMQAVLIAGGHTPMDSNGTWTAFPLYSMLLEKDGYGNGAMLLARCDNGNIEIIISKKYNANPNIGVRFALTEVPLED